MALNYYEGWTETELLTERRMIQQSLATGRIMEIRLAGETTRTDDRGAASLELTLTRIAYSLFKLYEAGTVTTVYADPYAVITIHSHY